MSAGVVTVRPFELSDLDAAAELGDRARQRDPSIEPFAQRLALIATGPRALLELWRVAQGEDGQLYGLAFVALRTAAEEGAPATLDLYCAVEPSLRRQGLGRALCEGALQVAAALRGRVRDDASAGRSFARALGFSERGAQLVLQWRGQEIPSSELPALRIRPAVSGAEKPRAPALAGARETPDLALAGAPELALSGAQQRSAPRAPGGDEAALQRLSREAWAGAPDTFATRADEIAQLFSGQGRVVLLAEDQGKPVAYLSAVQLGRTLGVEEIAVLPDYRRMGVGKALLGRALAQQSAAVLSVDESNHAARALYRSFGFVQSARRIVLSREA